MKTKLFIIAVLAAVVVALLVFSPHQRKHLTSPISEAVQNKQPAPLPTLALPCLAKMVTVATVLPLAQTQVSPTKKDWSDIQTIADEGAGYEKRVKAIGRLPSKLTDADWNVLRDYLLKPVSSDDGQLGQVLKNQLMDALCAMKPPPDGLGSVFTQMYQNLLQNEIVRDYALQHLATLDETMAQNGGEAVAKEEKVDQKILWDALNETGDSIAGTALLGLVRLSKEQNAGIDQNKVAAAALQLASNGSEGELIQITAYQICAQLNVQDALSTIEVAAQNSQTVSIQISAIGALGSLGGADDIPLLQNLAQENAARLKLPAQTAIEKIQARLGQRT